MKCEFADKRVEVQKIKAGECFMWSGSPYMRVQPSSLVKSHDVLAVTVSTGVLLLFTPETMVTRIEFIVKEI